MKTTKSSNKTQTVTVNGVVTEIKSTEKVVTSLLSQQQIVIDKDTPMCCDPSTETYWSM
jgi:uncharacterized protein YabE (DUF348 family)